jgi:hypothetical protein
VYVAIDRWTGGAADAFLYSVLEPHAVRWHPIELALDLGRVAQEVWSPAVALLLLVLSDLARGVLPLGFATNRGLGSLEVSEVTVEVEQGAHQAAEAATAFGWLAGTYPISRSRGLLGRLDPSRLDELRRTWARWLAEVQLATGGARS